MMLDWPGCRNVRDLGGLPTGDGRTTRSRSVVRADALDRLTPEGWAAVHAYGVRTVVDLREDDERAPSVARPAGLAVVHVPLDDTGDTGFWYRCLRGTTIAGTLRELLADLDVVARLRAAGLTLQDLRVVRARLVDDSPAGEVRGASRPGPLRVSKDIDVDL